MSDARVEVFSGQGQAFLAGRTALRVDFDQFLPELFDGSFCYRVVVGILWVTNFEEETHLL